jgi:hypothetical protein
MRPSENELFMQMFRIESSSISFLLQQTLLKIFSGIEGCMHLALCS